MMSGQRIETDQTMNTCSEIVPHIFAASLSGELVVLELSCLESALEHDVNFLISSTFSKVYC